MRRGAHRAFYFGIAGLGLVVLATYLVLFVDQRLSRACAGYGALQQDEVINRALNWVLESRVGEVRYRDVSDLLQHNPNCCQLVDPAQNNATDPAFGMPSRTSLIFRLLVPHYTIVVVTILADPTGDARRFRGAVAVDRCGEVLGWSNGAISAP